MGWKKWPYWLKGFSIGILLGLIGLPYGIFVEKFSMSEALVGYIFFALAWLFMGFLYGQVKKGHRK